MPRTVYDEEFVNGVLIRRTARVMSDIEIELTDAPQKLRSAYRALRNWKIDADDIVDNGVDAANDIEDVTFVGGLVVATKLLTGFTSYNYS